MFDNITIGQYIPGDSFLHKLDPRIKIILLIINIIVVFNIKTYIGFLLLYIFIFLIIKISGIPLGYTLRGVKPILYLLIFTAIINFATYEGETVLFSFWIFEVSVEAIDMLVKLALRLTLFIISTSLLTLSTTPIALSDAMESLMRPLSHIGFPSHEIAMMMTIALRFIPTLMEETDRIIKAQSARGADFDTGGLIQKAKSFVPIIIPLIVSSFRRAFDLAEAMEARCYNGGKGRTRYRVLKMERKDIFAAVIFLVINVGVLVAQIIIKI